MPQTVIERLATSVKELHPASRFKIIKSRVRNGHDRACYEFELILTKDKTQTRETVRINAADVEPITVKSM